jgi:hypothetical protein
MHVAIKRDDLLMLLATMADETEPADPVTEAVMAAVGAVAPELPPCLADPDPAVRRAAVRVAAVATDPKAVAERLTAMYGSDPDADVRADALTALARVDPDEAREAAALDDGVPAIRLAAALLSLERSAPPYPAEPVEVLAADGTEPGGDAFPFPGLGSQEHRLTTLLTADVDAGLAVAARWVAADDRGAIALISALDPQAAGRLLPELTDLLRAGRAAVPVARVLGTLDGVDRKTLRLLAKARKSDNEMLRATAAASHALLSGKAEPAIRVLAPLLTAGRQAAWYLPEAGHPRALPWSRRSRNCSAQPTPGPGWPPRRRTGASPAIPDARCRS